MTLKKPSDIFDKKPEDLDIKIVESDNTLREELVKVENLSEQVIQLQQELSQKIVKNDLESLVLSQINTMKENFDFLQNDFKKSNKKDILEFKEKVSELTDIIGNLVENELPKYKKQVTKTEFSIGERFSELKEIVENNIIEVDEKIDDIAEVIDNNLDVFNRQIQENFLEVKRTSDTYNKISNILESKVSKENDKLEEYSQVIQSIHKEFVNLEKSIQEKTLTYNQIIEDKFESISSNINIKIDNIDEDVKNKINNIDDKVDTFKSQVSSEVSNIKTDVVIFEKHNKDTQKTIQEFSEKLYKISEIDNDISNINEDIDKLNNQYGIVSNQSIETKKDLEIVERYIQKHHKELLELKEEVFGEIEKLPLGNIQENLESLEKKIDYIKETYSKIEPEVIVKEVIKEGLLNEPPDKKNSDPLTPLDQNFVTLDQLQQHYRLFINRIQQQISTIGGGGETRLKYLDDIVGIATNASAYDDKFLKYNHSIGKFEFVTVSGGGGGGSQTLNDTLGLGNTSSLGISVGISTFNNVVVGGATTALVVNGNARVTGILTIGTSSIVLDGANNKIYVGSGVTISATEISIGSNIIGSGGFSGSATFATNAGIATYATNAGIATYATNAGIATFATSAGIATFATNAGVSTYSDNAGIATYATNAGIATFATSAGIATFATNAGVSTYSDNAGIATYATNAGVSTYSDNAGIATYATNAGVSTYSDNAGIATFATSAGTATTAQGLTGTPNLNVGVVTATSFSGSGTALTGIVTSIIAGTNITVSGSTGQVTINASGGGSSQWVTTDVGIHTLSNVGIGTTNPTSKLHVVGDARITGILTIGTSSLVFDGTNNKIYVGSGVTISATEISIGSNIIGSGGFSGNASSATFATSAGIATYATNAGIATYATNAGIATYATNAGIATYATSAGIATYATYATNAGIATYATNAGIATYATNAGIATYATNAGIATYATNAGIATYATNAGIATYATNAGIATYATNAGIATYATSAGIATYATNAGIATYATNAGIATYATNAGIATYATSAGIATYATSAGIATYASSAGISTTAQGLTGTPNLSVGIITATQLSTGTSGTGVNISTDTISGPSLLYIDPAAVGDNTGAVRIKGDLYVDGTQFIVNSTTIELADFNVGIATTVGTNELLDGAGIGIGYTGIRKTLTWNNSSTALKSSEDFDIASGKVYRINGTSVLSNNTLGSGIVTSSLTSVGTLGSLSVGNVNSTGIITASSFAGNASSATFSTNAGIATSVIGGIASVTSLSVSGVSTVGVLTAFSIGIGTTNPTSSLHVVGNTLVTGIVTTSSLRGYSALVGTASSTTTTFIVTVASKTTNHRYYGSGSGSGYFIDGIESPFLTLLPGKTYRFTQEDASNSSHPILFYYQADKTTGYTTNVTTTGTPGSAGAYTEIVVTDTTPVVLHYQCSNHGYMGNAAHFSSNVVDTPYQITARSGISVTGVVTATTFIGELTGTATTAQGLTGTPNLNVGVVTATSFSGSGTALTGIVTSIIAGTNITVSGSTGQVTINSTASGGGSSQWVTTDVGIHTLSNVGIGTTNPTSALTVVGVVSATSFSGSGIGLTSIPAGQLTGALPAIDGSALTGIVASGSGVVIRDDGSLVGTATTIDFGANLSVSFASGIATITGSGGGGSQTLDTTLGLGNTSSLGMSVGVVTATSFSGSGTALTGIVTSIVAGTNITVSASTGQVTINSTASGGGGSSQWVTTDVGIHTLSNVGIGTTNPTSALTVVGVVSATSFSGSGAGLTNIPANIGISYALASNMFMP